MTPIEKINKNVYATFLSREEEWHRALGRDATFSWSKVLDHPPKCNKRITGRSGPSWIGRCGVIYPKEDPLLLSVLDYIRRLSSLTLLRAQLCIEALL